MKATTTNVFQTMPHWLSVQGDTFLTCTCLPSGCILSMVHHCFTSCQTLKANFQSMNISQTWIDFFLIFAGGRFFTTCTCFMFSCFYTTSSDIAIIHTHLSSLSSDTEFFASAPFPFRKQFPSSWISCFDTTMIWRINITLPLLWKSKEYFV